MYKFGILIFLVILMNSCCSTKHKDENYGTVNVIRNGKEFISLKPSIEIISEDTVKFILETERSIEIEKEYCPTSETFRVEIISRKGKTVWSSNYNKNFLQVISDVMPKKKGEQYKYTMEWNGKNNNNSPLPEGLYSVRMMIPANPKPYIISTEMDWKPAE